MILIKVQNERISVDGLYRIGFLTQDDFPAMVLQIFNSYMKLMRRMQEEYMLEPAGSHGVWGLDDYQCLAFYFGACQLVGQDTLVPMSIHDENLLSTYQNEYLYFAGVAFIKKVKKGNPFSETSPMLNDISGVPHWSKVMTGMMKLYEGEVLKKLPVIQHMLFGSFLPATWPHAPPSDTSQRLGALPDKIDIEGVSCKAPWAK